MNPSSRIFSFGGSDDKPILLELKKDPNMVPIPFRFNPLWTAQKDFLEVVKDAWSVSISGSASFVWEEKLRRTKKALKSWAKLIVSPSQIRLESQQNLEDHQHIMESDSIT